MPFLVYKSTVTARVVPEIHYSDQAPSNKSEHGGGFKGRVLQVIEITKADALISMEDLQQKYPYKG